MIRHLLLAVAWAGCTTTIEVAIFWPNPGLAYYINAPFIAAAGLAFLLPWPRSVWYSLALGLMIDWFSPLPFGTYLILCSTMVCLIAFLQQTWLKQMSLLSVAVISAIALAIVSLLLWGWMLTSVYIGWTAFNWFSPSAWWMWVGGFIIECVLISILTKFASRSYEQLF